MPVDDAPDDGDGSLRQTYNFAPGNHGLIYRAEAPDHGAGAEDAHLDHNNDKTTETAFTDIDGGATKETKYKLQAMKWGLIPFWTKRAPDYGSQLKTINCRDDSLAQSGGMWNTMKQKKRCIIIAEGFYEWLKKNNGKEKIPHFVKRKDGQLMCFAGLWDCVKYEGHDEKLYTYTIITTSSNKQLNFLHDRMPVILDNGSDQMKTWLDPARSSWTKELQSLLKPYQGDLECYPVDRAVGKVGNNSPSFIVPIDSKENKKNIANFFAKQKSNAKDKAEEVMVKKEQQDLEAEPVKVKKDPEETRETDSALETTEDNAPLPRPKDELPDDLVGGIKRDFPDSQDLADIDGPPAKKTRKATDIAEEPHLKSPEPSPASARKTRSATSNGTAAKAASKSSAKPSQKITAFFGK